MATGQAPDPGRKKHAHPHCTNFKVPNGTKEFGFKAGHVHGCYGHRTFAHQPCVLLITEGALQCAYCGSGLVPEWRGYVPIWDRDWTLRYAMIGETFFPSVDSIPFRAQVCLSRAKNPISPLIIREEVNLTRVLPDRSPWNEEVNTLDICLTLWQNVELAKWYAKHPPKKVPSGDNGQSLPKGTAKRADGKPFSPMMQNAAKKNGAYVAPEPTTLDEQMAKVQANLKKKFGIISSQNGNGEEVKKE